MAANPDFTDYYALLAVSPDADRQQIRLAYLKQAKIQHPDAGGSTEGMKQLNTAYKTLSNDMPKAVYDQLHSFHTNTPRELYIYQTGRSIHDEDDMTDAEIDSFLDTLLKEHSHKAVKLTLKQRMKRLFDTY